MRRRWSFVAGLLILAALPGRSSAAAAQIEALSYRDNRVLSFPADSTGLRAALDTLRTAGGVVTVPSGVYTITRSLTLWPNTTLAGEGWATVIRLQAPVNTPLRALRVSRRCRVATLTLRGTGYVSSDPKAYGATGIIGGADENGGMDSTVIEGCHITGWNTNGINLAAHSSHNVVKNNSIDSCGWEGIYVAQYCDDNSLIGNSITACRHNAIDIVGSRNVVEANMIRDIGIEIPDSDFDTYGVLIFSVAKTTGAIGDNTVRDNTIENCYEGIAVLASVDSDNHRATIRNNTVLESRKYGIRIGGGGSPLPRITGVRIESNQVLGCASDGILLDRIPRLVTVSLNYAFQNGGAGIRAIAVAGGTDSLVITSNRIWRNGGNGVEIGKGVERCIIQRNTFGPNARRSILDSSSGARVEDNREPTTD